MRQDIAICTISTRSHLAYARTMLASVRRWTPDAARVLLLVDDHDKQVRTDDGISIVHPTTIVDSDLFQHLLYKYNAAEVCFALKPHLLRWLLTSGYEQAHYIDGDAWVVGDLSVVTERLHGANIQLTPHLRSPLPLDGRNPTEFSLLRAGTFNAGYVGVARTSVALEFLEWWAERVQRWGINEPRFGMSGDQKWLDPVPNIFPGVVVNPDPGVNAAYWNLSGHEMAREAGVVTVDGQPLVLLHLSGFNPAKPDELSVFQNRINTTQHILLANMLKQYADEVMTNGHAQWSQQRYAYYRWWHSRWLPIRLARALLFHFRESRVNRTAQTIPPPVSLEDPPRTLGPASPVRTRATMPASPRPETEMHALSRR